MKKKITIEKESDLRNELIHVHEIDKNLVAMTGYVERHRSKIMNIMALLQTGLYDLEEALDNQLVSRMSFYRLRKAASEIEEKLEELGIEYEDTEFDDLIHTVKSIDRAMSTIQSPIKQKILERMDGKFNRTTVKKIAEDGKEYEQEMVVYDKPASATELIKIAEFFDKRKRQEVPAISIENNNANVQKSTKYTYEIIDPEYVINNLNNDVYHRTISKVDDIERQLQNGEFDE